MYSFILFYSIIMEPDTWTKCSVQFRLANLCQMAGYTTSGTVKRTNVYSSGDGFNRNALGVCLTLRLEKSRIQDACIYGQLGPVHHLCIFSVS